MLLATSGAVQEAFGPLQLSCWGQKFYSMWKMINEVGQIRHLGPLRASPASTLGLIILIWVQNNIWVRRGPHDLKYAFLVFGLGQPNHILKSSLYYEILFGSISLVRVEGTLREGSEDAIFGLSYGPGIMKFVISDPKNLYIQMEKVWDECFFWRKKHFFKLSTQN